MLQVEVNESFPLTVTMTGDSIDDIVTGLTVNYDVREFPGDVSLVPPKIGVLSESAVVSGVYSTILSISSAGNYIIYVTCAGFFSGVEEVLVVDNNAISTSAASFHYNLSVENVLRTSTTPSASQIIRKVPLGKTDYVITKIKRDHDVDWSSPISQGSVYAWYKDEHDKVPYKMGGQQ